MRVHAGHVAHHDTELDALIRPQSGVDIAELLIGPDLRGEHLIARAIAAAASMLNDAAAHTVRRCEERARIPDVAVCGQHRVHAIAADGAGTGDAAVVRAGRGRIRQRVKDMVRVLVANLCTVERN